MSTSQLRTSFVLALGACTLIVGIGISRARGGTAADRRAASPIEALTPDGYRVPDDVEPLPGMVGFSARWNGTAFIQDNLWTDGDDQFAVWVGARGEPIVARRRLPDGRWTTRDLSTLDGNPLRSPTVEDEHNVYAVATDRRGHVHVAGNMHATELRYVRSRDAGSLGAWIAGPMTGSQEASVTYPAFVRAGDGPLLFFYRDGTAGDGDVIVDRFDDARQRWERAATLVAGQRNDESSYVHHIAADGGDGSLHVFLLARRGLDPSSNGGVSYVRSDDDGSSWVDGDGRPVALPLTDRSTLPVDVAGRGDVVLNQGGAAVDARGRPHAIFRLRDTSRQRSSLVHVWRDDHGWQAEPVVIDRAMSGRPALVAGPGAGVSMLWTEPDTEDGSATIWLSPLGRSGGREERLLRIPMSTWEVAYDSVALVGDGLLRLMVPTTVRRAGRSLVGTGAVVTFDLGTPADARRPSAD